MFSDDGKVMKNYENAREICAAFGVNTDEIIEKMKTVQISLHCW